MIHWNLEVGDTFFQALRVVCVIVSVSFSNACLADVSTFDKALCLACYAAFASPYIACQESPLLGVGINMHVAHLHNHFAPPRAQDSPIAMQESHNSKM